MSEPGHANLGPTSAPPSSSTLDALLASASAFLFAMANTLLSRMDGFTWAAMGVISAAGLFAGMSYLTVIRARSTPAMSPRNVRSIRVGRSAADLCYWIVPALWLFLTTYLISYVVTEIAPTIRIGSLWVIVPSAVALAFALSYLPTRGTALLVGCVAALQLAAATVFMLFAIAHHRSTPAANVLYTLDPDGAPMLVVQQDDVSSIFHVPAPPTPPIERFAHAFDCVALFSLFVFQFLASLASRVTGSRRRLRYAVVVLIGLSLAAQCVVVHAAESASPVFADQSVPVGDITQLLGAWAFGSARAGWWFMLSEMTSLGLLLVAATWICLRAGVGPDAPAPPRRNRLLRAAVATVLCVTGSWYFTSFTLLGPVYGPGVQKLLSAAQTVFPDLVAVLWLSVIFALLVTCAAMCFASLSAGGLRARSVVASWAGLASAATCASGLIVGPLIFRGVLLIELGWALLLCAAWGIGSHLLHRRFHRSVDRAAAGLCPGCGYDLRGTPERCPECGRANQPSNFSVAGRRG